MAIQIGEDKSMSHQPVARFKTAQAMRIGAPSRSLLQELIPAGDVHAGAKYHVPQDGKIPQQDVANIGGISQANAICGNQHILMEDIPPSEKTDAIINIVTSQAYIEDDTTSHNGRGQWTSDEDRLLRKLVKKQGEKKWSKIANGLRGRIGKQCRERWFNHLSPNIKKSDWTIKEEQMLVAWHRKLGNKWAKMAKHIPNRPENTIKNHWNATLRRLKSKRPSKVIEMAVKNGTRSNVLELYMRELGLNELKEAGAPASPPGPDMPVLDAVSAAGPAEEQSSGPDSADDCWMHSLCGGMLPSPLMEAPETEPEPQPDDCVYVVYDNDNGYVRYVHLQPTPGHGYAPVNQVAAAEYYNPLPLPYCPFAAQQVYAHNSYPAGHNYQEAGPSHHYSNSGDEAHGNSAFDPAASGLGGMPPSAIERTAQNQRGGSAN